MSFLDWIADWAEGIPGVGEYIADIIRAIQSAIESAYGWIEAWVAWLRDTFYPWVVSTFESVWDSLSALWDEIYHYIESWLESLESGLDTLTSWYYWVADEVNDFVSDPFGYIDRHLPSWIKDWLRDLQNAFDSFKDWATDEINAVRTWIDNAERWFSKQLEKAKDTILSWVDPLIKPLSDWIDSFKREFAEFLKDPVGYITKAVQPLIDDLGKKLSAFSDWVNEQFGNVKSAILGIDDFLKAKLLEFIGGFAAWFLWSFLNDLVTLEYDPETGEVYGEPKNPVTHFLIWYFEVEKPEWEYKSVEKEVTS